MSSAQPETVYLVGAGPGDPGLMTTRACELIRSCDCILYDRLIPPGALEAARPDCELHYVGKQPGGSVSQAEIEELMISLARSGRSVLRLKGGDPFVFGRGGEEAQVLAAAGVSYEVVPGVTAGVAAPAYAGIPVTHRDDVSAVCFLTGHNSPDTGDERLDWRLLASFPGTLVCYMAVKQLRRITSELIAGGRSASEPSAAIEAGTLAAQRTIEAPLASLADSCERASLSAPAIVVIGQVAGLRPTLKWFERRPLFGKRVVVTRARAQASEFAHRLRLLGAEVVEAPAIRIEPRPVAGDLRAALEQVGSYELICLTSPNGARLFFEGLQAVGRDARALAHAQIAAIGPATAGELATRAVTPDIVPERAVAEELAAKLEALDLDGRRVLIARAASARDVLVEALNSRGANVDTVALYDTVCDPLAQSQLAQLGSVDYVTFTSSSTVRYFCQSLGDSAFPQTARIASIGPVTSATVREHGLAVAVEAQRHDIDGLVAALLTDVNHGSGE